MGLGSLRDERMVGVQHGLRTRERTVCPGGCVGGGSVRAGRGETMFKVRRMG